MSLVQQRLSSDCALCATAMLLGKTYEEIWSVTPDKFKEALATPGDGVDGSFELDICDALGFEGYWLSKLYLDRPAILVVASLTRSGMHAIYFDGERLWDPQEGRPNKPFYSGNNIPIFKHTFQLEEKQNEDE